MFDAYKKIVLFVLPPDGDMKHYRSVEGADFCRQHTENFTTSFSAVRLWRCYLERVDAEAESRCSKGKKTTGEQRG